MSQPLGTATVEVVAREHFFEMNNSDSDKENRSNELDVSTLTVCPDDISTFQLFAAETISSDDEGACNDDRLISASDPVSSGDSPSNMERKKKRKGTFGEYKSEKMDYASISSYLTKMQEGAYWCCRLLCYTWITTNLVLFCREQYLLIETTKERREWLERRLSEMESFANKRLVYAYYVDFPDKERRRCCQSAWEFSYGVSPATRANASRKIRGNGKPTTSTKKLSKWRRREGFSDSELYMVAWLNQFANRCGDVLPFGDHIEEAQIRLPFGKKINYGSQGLLRFD
jgi:hypothetical protein